MRNRDDFFKIAKAALEGGKPRRIALVGAGRLPLRGEKIFCANKMNPKIAVFSGGISPEREVSLVSGENVFKALSEKFDAVSVRLDENALPPGLDPDEYVIFPAMHGDYGEDGTLQGQLDAAGFEYAGCGSLSSPRVHGETRRQRRSSNLRDCPWRGLSNSQAGCKPSAARSAPSSRMGAS